MRGIGYGQPGETEIATCVWNKFSLDTVEMIVPVLDNEMNPTGHYSRYRYINYRKGLYHEQYIRRIPAEYKTVKGFDYFLGKI